jgi:hypothetical protein
MVRSLLVAAASIGLGEASCNHEMNLTHSVWVNGVVEFYDPDEHAQPLADVGENTTTKAKVKYDILCLMLTETNLLDHDDRQEDDEDDEKNTVLDHDEKNFWKQSLRQYSAPVPVAPTKATPTWKAESKADAQATYALAAKWNMPEKVRNWVSWDDMENFLHERAQENSHMVVVDQPRSEMGQEVKILERQIMSWASVKLTCHLWGPKESFCHMPVRHQRFFLARVMFEDGHENTLMFAEHNMEPGCTENCVMMHHVVETALVEDLDMPPLFDNLRRTMVSV